MAAPLNDQEVLTGTGFVRPETILSTIVESNHTSSNIQANTDGEANEEGPGSDSEDYDDMPELESISSSSDSDQSEEEDNDGLTDQQRISRDLIRQYLTNYTRGAHQPSAYVSMTVEDVTAPAGGGARPRWVADMHLIRVLEYYHYPRELN